MGINNVCLIIGTQKGGTTSLFYYLSQHPQVSASRIKETNFFSRDRTWDKGLAYYESLWKWDPQKHHVALEASPNYTISLAVAKKVIQRLKTVNSTFKFIYILRNPIEKIESMRKHGVYQGWYSQLLEKETPDSLPLDVIERVSYATMIKNFENAFSLDNILLLKTDDLNSHPTTLMGEICQFLEIDASFKFCLDKVHNTQNSYRQDTVWHSLRGAKYLRPLKNIVPDVVKNKARSILSQPLEKNTIKVPPLTAAQKEFILDALKDEMQRLETDYSLDLSNWRQANNCSLERHCMQRLYIE